MRHREFLAIVLLLSGTACLPGGKTTAPPPREGAAYFPLIKGSWWLYRVEDVVAGWRFERKVEVTRRQVITALGCEAAIIEETYTTDAGPFFRAPVQPVGLYWKNGYLNSVYLSDSDLRPIEGIDPVRVLPETVATETTWTGEPSDLAPADLGMRIDRRHELHVERSVIRVPAGSFDGVLRVDTIAVHRGSAPVPSQAEVSFFYSDWYAPGIGLVRSETWDDAERHRLRTRIELVRFHAEALLAGPGGSE